jgi:exopolysaccharide production protein ExoQ
MAIPALLCCLFFIGFLLVLDSRRRGHVSWTIWIPTILLLILGSRSVSLWLGQGQVGGPVGNDAERSPLDQAFFFLVLASSLTIATLRHVRWGKLIVSNIPLMMFYVYFAISISWSGDPLGSTKRLVKDFGMLSVISLILSEKNPLEAIRTVYVRCACVLFPLSVVFNHWFPQFARSFSVEGEPVYTGVTTQKNTLGEIVLVFSLFLIWDYLETRPAKWQWRDFPWDRLLLLGMGLQLLSVCQSKTALLCLFLGAALIVRSGRFASKMVSRIVLVGALSLPYLLFFAQQFNSVIAPMVEAMGRNMTFTGRTDIWEHITSRTVNPLIGAGYWNFWGGPGGFEISELMQTSIPNAHNGYLDIYLDGGIIGLILLFFM